MVYQVLTLQIHSKYIYITVSQSGAMLQTERYEIKMYNFTDKMTSIFSCAKVSCIIIKSRFVRFGILKKNMQET